MLNDKGEEVGIIYGWYNIKCGKWYVGQTVNPEGRFNCHIDRAINKKDKTYFYNSIRKYGLENFVYCIIEDNVLRDNLNMKEQEWIEYYDSFYCGYNMTAGGNQTIFSEEFKEKMSEVNKGRIPWNKGKHGIYSEETLKKLSKSLKGKPGYWTNKHLSEETKKKLSESLKGKPSWQKGKPSYNRKPVLKYDLNGNFIKKYDCITDALKENPKAGHIGEVCNGYRKQTGGFIWKYAS